MKRFIILLSILVPLTLMALTPEEVVGHWVSDGIKMNSGRADQTLKMVCDYTFKEDGSVDVKYRMNMDIDYNKNLNVNAYYDITAQGTYAVAENAIVINFNAASIKANVDPDDVRINEAGIAHYDKRAEQEKQEQFARMLQNTADLMVAQMADNDELLSDVNVNGKTLTCVSGEQTIKFKKKK